MHQLSKRLCAILLTLCMVIGFLPMTARAALVDSAGYINQSLTLGGALQMNLLSETAKISDYIGKGSVEITYPIGMDRKNTETKTYSSIEDTSEKTVSVDGTDTDYRYVTVDRVVAQMSDEIELVVKSDLGVEVINQTYSIRDYLIALLEGTYTSQTKELCYETLNYGAWAQKYFKYNTGNLANEGYEIQPGYNISDAEVRDVTPTGDLTGIKVYGASVVFLSETTVRFYFSTANDIKDYTFTVDGITYTPRAKSGLYFIEVPNINPQEMETEMKVQVTDSTNNLSFTYAPIDFFIRSYEKSSDDTYKGLLAAAYSYYKAAKAFAGNSTTGAIELNLVYSTGNNSSITVKTDVAYAPGMTVNSATGNWSTGVSQTQDATGVAVTNVDSMAALTFTFGNEFAVGDTYSLPKGMAFVLNNQEYVLAEDYVFQLAATGESTYTWNTVEPVATGDKLLGFNNYTEITGADTGVKLSVGNMLGRMELNVDPRYVSEGVASLKVQPQGDYNNPGKHPYIKLDMSGEKYTATYDATISQITSHDDFSGYKSISFDVYNPEAVAQEIRAGLMIGSSSYISTNKQKFTLAPNSWTTCTYDLSVMAGFGFYELNSERFIIIEFLDHKESKADVPPVLYIDDLVGNPYQDGEGPVDTVYNYRNGIDFETSGLEYLFIGQGNMERDATIERVSYAESGISGPANGGSYGLKLSHDSDYYPTFRIHFGETLPAGTAVTFDAYGVITSGTYSYDQSIFEFSSATGGAAGEATETFPFETWTALEFTLNADADYVDLFWNIDRAGITSSTASGEVYIDNVKIVEDITPEGNILDGLSFEKIGNTAYFSSTSSDTVVRRMPYASLGIDAPTGGDQYALEVTGDGETATVTIDFGGQTLAAGTVISFKLYGTHSGGWVSNSGKMSLSCTNGSLSTSSLSDATWTDVTITLGSAATSVSLTGKVSYFISKPDSVSMYIDNVKAVEPVGTASGNYYDGIGFEVKENAYYFVGQGGNQDASIRRVAYADLDISAPADGGSYALKLSHDSDQWPHFRVNFHDTLPAGTVIAFQAYLKANASGNTVFEYNGDSSGTATDRATMEFAYNAWHTLTMTLPAAASYVDLFWNLDLAGFSGSSELYVDNFVVVSGNFEDGVNFESVGHTGMFTGQGAANDAVLARVSYADLSIGEPTNGGGTYALMLSTVGNDRWPKFRVNFGETLPAGTLITFDAYGKITNGANTMNKSIFEYSTGGDVTAEFVCDKWTTLYIVLNEATSYLDLFWNLDRAGFTEDTSSGEVYLDNFKAVVPETSASVTLLDGVDFETTGQSGLFVGLDTSDHNAAITRIPYSLTGVEAPAGGGEYALRLSHSSHGWPTFRINFGKTLPVGTVITYDVYADYTSWHDVTQTVTMLSYSDSGDCINSEFSYNQWMHMSFALTSETDHVDLFWNINNAGITMQNNNAHLYLDNILAEEPVELEGDITVGYGFEAAGNALFFTDVADGNNAVRKRVSYANAGITAPTDGGEYALQLTNSSFRWPRFRLDFGQELAAGTTITFDAYVSYPEALTMDQAKSLFAMKVDGSYTDVTPTFAYNTWTELTITLPAAATYVELYWNMNQLNETYDPAQTVLYLDNFLAVEPIIPEGDFLEGVDFEVEGNIGLFTAVGGDYTSRDAVIKRISYTDAGIATPTNGGTYAMKLTHASNMWPTFRINFGDTLKAGTVITFNALVNYAQTLDYNSGRSVFEPIDSAVFAETSEFTYNEWAELSITLLKDADYIDLFWNVNRGTATIDPTEIALYLDNFLAVEPLVFTGDFEVGVGFEDEGDTIPFTGVGGNNAWRDASFEIVAQEDLDEPLENGGSYALMLTCASSQYPTFRINFGKTLPSGTVVSFDAYTNDTSDTRSTVSVFEYVAGGDATVQYYHGSWNNLSFTLAADCDYVDLVCNMDRWNETDCANIEVYLDNFVAVITEDADFLAGVTFETLGHEASFTATGGDNDATIARVSYSDLSITVPENGGEYALKLSHSSFCWPTFRINFGKTLVAGTTITFNAYGGCESSSADTAAVKMELTGEASKANANGSDGTDQVFWMYHDEWGTATIVLVNDCSYLDLFYNIGELTGDQDAASYFYMDNFLAVEPVTEDADFEAGVTFETLGHEASFVGITDTQAATVDRVSYADLSVEAPTNGGDYALALSHASNCWPKFRINFGKTLPAGTVITFNAYGNYDYVAAEGETKYMKVELIDKTYATSESPDQVIWTVVDTWATGTVTLTADSDHLDLMYNVADSSHGNVSSVLLLDNIKAVVPEVAFLNGVTFEEESHTSFFTGSTDGIAIERVSYTDAGVSATTNGGSYALKLSHASNCWPNFHIDFGKTLPAGTTITFDAYGNYDFEAAEGVDKYIKVELTADAKTYAASSSTEQVIWTVVDTWATGTITLTADSDHLDLFWNVADSRDGESLSSWILLDNIKVVEPIGTSLSFEFAYQADYFTGTGGGNDATIERVSYADAGIAAPTNGGEYALKLSRSSAQIAYFRINFGRTMPAGTTIKLDAYNMTAGDHLAMYYDSPAWGDAYWKLNGEMYEEVTLTTTIASDCSYVDLYMEPQNGSDADFYIIIDNIQFIEP